MKWRYLKLSVIIHVYNILEWWNLFQTFILHIFILTNKVSPMYSIMSPILQLCIQTFLHSSIHCCAQHAFNSVARIILLFLLWCMCLHCHPAVLSVVVVVSLLVYEAIMETNFPFVTVCYSPFLFYVSSYSCSTSIQKSTLHNTHKKELKEWNNKCCCATTYESVIEFKILFGGHIMCMLIKNEIMTRRLQFE